MHSFAFVTLLALPFVATTALGQTTDSTGARLDSALHALEAKGFEPGDDVELGGVVFELDPS